MKKVIRIDVTIVLEVWPEQKQLSEDRTDRRWAAPGQRIRNKNIMNRRQPMFKIKTLLPEIKQVEVKKNRSSS